MLEPASHPFVAIRVRPNQLSLAQLRLWELGATGLEERDQTTLVRAPADGYINVLAAFPDEATARNAWEEIRKDYEAEISHVPDQDWATEWRRGFGVQRIGRRLLLRPSWEPAPSDAGDAVLTIDPENAFGSGDHETTRMVLQLLDRQVAGGEQVLDVGCGSGILSIAALLLGARRAVAIDTDEDAVAVTRRNAAINGVASSIEASTRPLAEIDGGFDIVLANIETRVLICMHDDLSARVRQGGMLVMSGVLRTERDELLTAYSSMRLQACLHRGEWCACLLRPVQS